jgi:hypothetical protein
VPQVPIDPEGTPGSPVSKSARQKGTLGDEAVARASEELVEQHQQEKALPGDQKGGHREQHERVASSAADTDVEDSLGVARLLKSLDPPVTTAPSGNIPDIRDGFWTYIEGLEFVVSFLRVVCCAQSVG